MSNPQRRTSVEERLAAAKAALGRAEQSVGVRGHLSVVSGGAQGGGVQEAGRDGSALDGGVLDGGVLDSGVLSEGVERLSVAPPPSEQLSHAQALGDVLQVPAALASLLPEGLPRGSVVQVSGSTSVLLAMVGAATSAGAWCAMAGVPHLGWAAAAAAGVALDRVVAVPEPGPDAPQVLAALADGFDVLVAGPCRALTARDQRSLTARLRARDAVLLTCAPWPEAHLHLQVGVTGWQGVEAGRGYVRAVDLQVRATGRLALRSGTQGHELAVRLGSQGLQPATTTAGLGALPAPVRAIRQEAV